MSIAGTWNTIASVCASPLTVVGKALDDVNISNTLFKTIKLISELAYAVLSEMESIDLYPAILTPFGKAFDGFSDVVMGRRWIKDLTFFTTKPDFAWENPIAGIYPDFFLMGSKLLNFGNNLIDARKWAGKVGILPTVEDSIGKFSLLGVEGNITLGAFQDITCMAAGCLDLTNDSRLFAQAIMTNGNYVRRFSDVVSSSLNVTGIALGQFNEPYFQIAAKVCRLAGNLIRLSWFTYDNWPAAAQVLLPPPAPVPVVVVLQQTPPPPPPAQFTPPVQFTPPDVVKAPVPRVQEIGMNPSAPVAEVENETTPQ